jgi:hypothetical protein
MWRQRIAGSAARRAQRLDGEFWLKASRDGHERPVAPRNATMAAPPSIHPPLARAHLALADDPDAAAAQHSLPRALVVTAAAVVLAFATPLAWVSTTRGELPRDVPAATLVKAGDGFDDDEDDAS